jgi:hypothetical protein
VGLPYDTNVNVINGITGHLSVLAAMFSPSDAGIMTRRMTLIVALPASL